MPLYLDEIWFRWGSPAEAKEVLTRFRGMATTDFPWPPGVTLKAGPWFSNEEAKIVLVLDIADHARTFVPFVAAMTHRLLDRRRLTPIVEASAVDDVLEAL
jgi:hypothetical protein